KPDSDATVARKLRADGAIILGKGTLTEFANFIAFGMPTGYSSQLRFQLFQLGGDLAKVGYGFNSYDPRIDPRTTAPFNDGRPVLQTGGSSSGPGIAVAHIAVPKNPYWTSFGLGANRTALMNAAIAKMTALGATFEDCDLPDQGALNAFNSCLSESDTAAREAAGPTGTAPCTSVLGFGFKRDLNTYLANPNFGPG